MKLHQDYRSFISMKIHELLIYKPKVRKRHGLWEAWLYTPYGVVTPCFETWEDAFKAALHNAEEQLAGRSY